MKIGDKVRFLNEVGGGIVSGFQDAHTVLVRDEDGFDIPMLVSNCVVIDTDDYNIAKVNTGTHRSASNRFRSEQADRDDRSFDDDEDDKPVTFKPKAQERRGADLLNVYLAFVPVDPKDLSDTAFEAYLINDSNYCLRFGLFESGGAACQLRHEGMVEPNTKLFLEEFRRDVLGEWERLAFQAFAYKEGKPFRFKNAVDVALRLDATKFYKLHTFAPTDFFEENALLVDVVRDDKPIHTAYFDATRLEEALAAAERPARVLRQPARKEERAARDKNAPLEVDLHASEVLETTAGMSNKDILDYQLKTFHDTMSEYAGKRGQKIVFIHGKGNGVLRNAIVKELQRRYKSCHFQDASFREYGFGATLVVIG